MDNEKFDDWAIVELMGHRRLAGHVTEIELAGKGMLRVDIPGPGDTSTTQIYSPDSLYCLTPTTEEIARAVALNSQPTPVHRFELPAHQEAEEDDDPEEMF